MSDPVRIGLLCSRIRVEEKLLRDALVHRGMEVEIVDDREVTFTVGSPRPGWDVVLERSISQTRGLAITRILESWGVPTINTARSRSDLCQQAGHHGGAGGRGRPDPRDGGCVHPRCRGSSCR